MNRSKCLEFIHVNIVTNTLVEALTVVITRYTYLQNVLLVLLFTKFFNLLYFCATFDSSSYIVLYILNLTSEQFKIRYVTIFFIMVLKFLVT